MAAQAKHASRNGAVKGKGHKRYRPIADYALLSDCHGSALVSSDCSIDWCCVPRFDSGTCFGRLLDAENGGFWSMRPSDKKATKTRRYIDDSLVLETMFHCADGDAAVIDFFALSNDLSREPHPRLVRIVEGRRGVVKFQTKISVIFDYGDLRAWIRRLGPNQFGAIGGDDGLIFISDVALDQEEHILTSEFELRAGEHKRFGMEFARPERLERDAARFDDLEALNSNLKKTLKWWKGWAKPLIEQEQPHGSALEQGGALRSAVTLKALTYQPTGAITAAATTSLPESWSGDRNWDYRFSWIRDASFTVRSLAELGYETEANDFRKFIERSSAGSADELQILYGIGGERRMPEIELDGLEGYRGIGPVRIGNAAAHQIQHDAVGYLLGLAWDWHLRGHSPDDDYWRFLVALVDRAAARWHEPDRGIWEWRGKPKHFVHSKVLCWAALDRGIQLAESASRKGHLTSWKRERKAVRNAIETEGMHRSGHFVQAFGGAGLDSALLRIPTTGFIDFNDERMVATVDRIIKKLDRNGLLARYETKDGLSGTEGAFIPCTFWLVQCLSRQGRVEEARDFYETAAATANDLGLFSEEYDTERSEMLGNFPQALTHIAHIEALMALAEEENRVLTL